MIQYRKVLRIGHKPTRIRIMRKGRIICLKQSASGRVFQTTFTSKKRGN